MSSSGDSGGSHSNQNQLRRPPRDFYPAPPPPRPPPSRCRYSATYYSSSTLASLKGCCCCVLLLLTFIALLLIAVVLVIALVVKPKKPHVDLQQVAVSYLLLTTPSGGAAFASAAYLTLNITMIFSAENPNRIGINCGASTFTVMYRGVALGKVEIPGFEEPARSTRLVQATVVVDRVDILQADALQLVRDAAINDRVELNVAGDVGARIRVLGISSPRVQVSLSCAVVISPRKQSVTEKQCGVDGLNV